MAPDSLTVNLALPAQACSSAEVLVWVSEAGGQVADFVAVQLHDEANMQLPIARYFKKLWPP